MTAAGAHVRGAGFSHLGRRRRQEDRWAVAEVGGLAIGAVADGMSQPPGVGSTGLGPASAPSASDVIAELAVSTFVEVTSRRIEAHDGPEAAVRAGFEAAREATARVGASGAAAFVGACLTADGTLSLVKVGDCRAFADFGDGLLVRATTEDDADRSGALTAWLGASPTGARASAPTPEPVIVRRGCRALVLASDGVWRTLAAGASPPGEAPFVVARELVTGARRAGETDNLAAVVLAVTAPERASSLAARVSTTMLVVAALLFFVAGLVAASLIPEGWR
ncbi:MAG: hypothetical protein IT385_12180 [Deltaproteobacteria bacterium]|nr:hypothetical protein [Deltaproteobacteria bacterium]